MPASGSSKIVSLDFLAERIAISILLSYPPEREALISLFKYSCAHNPTSDK